MPKSSNHFNRQTTYNNFVLTEKHLIIEAINEQVFFKVIFVILNYNWLHAILNFIIIASIKNIIGFLIHWFKEFNL